LNPGGFLLHNSKNLSCRVQSGPAGYLDKSAGYTILPIKTASKAVKNLCRRVQSGFAGY
jgi:hypothetical protein